MRLENLITFAFNVIMVELGCFWILLRNQGSLQIFQLYAKNKMHQLRVKWQKNSFGKTSAW
jgi:hypothetical protein